MKKFSKEDLLHYSPNNLQKTKGILFIVATPIGNFDDISLRAIKILSFVDVLLCEDTRKTKRLLTYLNINHNKLMSYNDNNSEKKRPNLINKLLMNQNIGLVSDAGTPLISDPGYKMVQECYLNNIKVTHLPGPSSVINALILSGLPTNQFYFGGFVSSKKTQKEKQFSETKFNTMTGIWFDTCLRIENTLQSMLNIYGNRKVSITRELTKTYEEVIKSELEKIHDLFEIRKKENIPLKGEVVIIVNGFKIGSNQNIEDLKIDIKQNLKEMSLKDTVEKMMTKTGFSRRIVYNEAIKIKNKWNHK